MSELVLLSKPSARQHPAVITGQDVTEGRLQFGDFLAIRNSDGTYDAAIVDMRRNLQPDPKTGKTTDYVPRFLSGKNAGKFADADLSDISDNPIEDLARSGGKFIPRAELEHVLKLLNKEGLDEAFAGRVMARLYSRLVMVKVDDAYVLEYVMQGSARLLKDGKMQFNIALSKIVASDKSGKEVAFLNMDNVGAVPDNPSWYMIAQPGR